LEDEYFVQSCFVGLSPDSRRVTDALRIYTFSQVHVLVQNVSIWIKILRLIDERTSHAKKINVPMPKIDEAKNLTHYTPTQ